MRARAPFDGPLTVGIRDAIHHLDNGMAQAILIQEVGKDADMIYVKEDDSI
jgi:hypothetical protein